MTGNQGALPALESTIHETFARVVARSASALALDTGTAQYSYEDLDTASTALARVLCDHGVSGDAPVALATDEGAWLTVGILATVRTGGFYLPLDPTAPTSRLAETLDAAGAQVLVTTADHVESVRRAAGPAKDVVTFDSAQGATGTGPVMVPVGPGAPAMLGFTAGSTGQPKGLVRPHRGELLGWLHHSDVGVRPDDRVGLLYGGAAPGALGSPLRAVLAGASLHTFDLRRRGLTGLAEWLRRDRISVVQFAPSVLRHFLEILRPGERFPDLRLLYLGGEPLLGADVLRARRHIAEDAVIVNRFGASETGLLTQHTLRPEDPVEADEPIPLGKPAPGVRITLLDEDGTEAEPGLPGRVVVRSRYASLGHWRRPELDAGTFSPDPDDPEARLVHLADRFRALPDGTLVHAGRADDVVKISGNRIALSEVEGALMRLAAVQRAAVVVDRDAAGFDRLLAYVVPADADPPPASSLRRDLVAVLPNVMLPARVEYVDDLPVLPSGKLDRRALSARR